jgi:hypothetical protein
MCKTDPSATSWRFVGIAAYQLGQISDADAALAEANLYDNNDPEVCLFCF